MPNFPPTRSQKPLGSRNNEWERDKNVRSPIPHQKKYESGDKDDDDQPKGLSLKFQIRRSDGKHVLTKWDGDKLATWGETGKSAKSYEAGEIMFRSVASWHWLTKMFEEDGLPLDPDPLTTIDIMFDVISMEVVEAKKYPYGYIILHVDSSQKFVKVAPVIRVEYDSIVFPNRKPLPPGAKKPKYQLIMLRGGIRKWHQRDLQRMIISNHFSRMAAQSEKLFAFVATLGITATTVLVGGATKSAASAAKGRVKDLILKRLRKRFKEALLKTLKVIDRPAAKALIELIKTFGKELAKDQALKAQLEANRKFALAKSTKSQDQTSINLDEMLIFAPGPNYAKSDPYLKAAKAASNKAVQLFVTELLNEMIDKKLKSDAKLARRVDHIINETEISNFISRPLQDELTKTVFDFLVTKQATGMIDIIYNASTNATSADDFSTHLSDAFKKHLHGQLLEMFKSSLKVLNFKAGD